jgi:hypothetical protein
MKLSKIIIFILLSIIIIIGLYNKNNNIESFENIISKLDYSAGFYSQIFFLINHYIYCKENKKNFKIDSNDWIYKSKDGWTDYFENIELNFYDSNSESNSEKIYGHNNTLYDYNLESYKKAIPEIYIYNQSLINNINNIKKNFNLIEYDSIYIRRGDKLVDEIKLSQESIYIKLLLEKNPNCKTIFLQTDDYICFINLQKYINENGLNIRLVTICNETSYGAITNNHYKNKFNNSLKENSEYISSIRDKLENTKPIEYMNNKEKYEHTMELLTGVDICLHSNICICDFSSNVSRFIKLAHDNTNNVFDIHNRNFDFSEKICPAVLFF